MLMPMLTDIKLSQHNEISIIRFQAYIIYLSLSSLKTCTVSVSLVQQRNSESGLNARQLIAAQLNTKTKLVLNFYWV